MNRFASFSEPTTCCYAEEHDNNPLRYICLDDQCQLNRLLCKVCVKNSHSKHTKWCIDKLIFPLDRLSMHSNYEGSTEDCAFLRQQVQIIRNEWQRMTDLFCKVQQDLNAGFVRQLETLMITFSTEQIDKAERVLTNKDSDIQQINKYVQMLKFLQKQELSDVNAMKKFAGDNTHKIAKVIKWATKKIGHILEKTTQIIKSVDFSTYADAKRQEAKMESIEEHQQMQSIMEEEPREVKRPQRRPNINPLAQKLVVPALANSDSSSTKKTMIKYK